jgi:outer membrane receptor protein involved in Fe transport
MMNICIRLSTVLVAVTLAASITSAAEPPRKLSGVVVTIQNEAVAGATVTVTTIDGERSVTTGADGAFSIEVPEEGLVVKVSGKDIDPIERLVSPLDLDRPIRLVVSYVVPPIHESVVIVDTTLDPSIDRRNEAIYRSTLFSRDDQVFDTLAAGINAGQHEGGGKSLEVRRFGFNMDHGGVNGGLKVLVDNVQQNHATQGHGQGYLGQLKSLTPELVQEVSIVNGPFSAQYGDFSGLGVVHIQLRESMADRLTLRLQGGSFDTFRGFVAYSPDLERDRAYIAYEASRTDGPFLNPLRYQRDNVSGNYTWNVDERQAVSFKLNYGRNDYFSSAQIPLDLVFENRLDRYGFIDPDNGGKVDSGVFSVNYRKELASGEVLKVDGFVARSLFDHFINFTFFVDEVNGDEIVQHDSRLMEGVNAQLLKPFELFGNRALLTVGGNFHDNNIAVGLWRSKGRDPFETTTSAHAHVTNGAGYAQQTLELFHGHLRLEGGLRFDAFRFAVDDLVAPERSGAESAGRWQPKAAVAWTPSDRVPVTLSFNYGRGISSQDARGVVQKPDSPRISTTDFYQAGVVLNLRRVSVASDLFLIDRSNEQVYIPDDGSIELAGPSRAYGWEAKTSMQLARHLSFNGGFTKVGNAFYRGTLPRVYVDSAPHFVANAGLTLSEWRGFTGSLRYRHTSNYRLDGENADIRASGLDVLDVSMSRRIARWVDFNLAVDNVTNKRYFETQNYYESRVAPGAPLVERIHATPGYPVTLTMGLTFRLFAKD